MKNYLLAIVAAGLIAVSCKKDRTCSCTVTSDGTTTTHTVTPGFPPIIPATDTTTYQPFHSVNTLKTTYTSVTKSTIRSSCYAKSEETLNQSTTSNSPGIYTITTTDSGTKTYDCKIE